jgi:integrase/recombinase XerD
MERSSPFPRGPSSTVLGGLHEQFIAEQRFSARRSPATVRGYLQSFSTFTSLMPTLTVAQLTPNAMTEFFRRLDSRSRLVGRGHQRIGVKTSTIATYRSKLGRFFRWLAAQGHLGSDPFRTMPYPRVQYEDRKYLSRSAVERIFSTLILNAPWKSRMLRRRNLAIFATLLYTGVRRGELLGLRITDIDLDRLELTVRAETSKSRQQRTVPISSKLAAALEDYLAERRGLPLLSDQLFTNAAGRQALATEGLKHLIERVKRASGVPFHAHQFRHTFAVNFLNRGGDVAVLKQLLGHRDIRMTSGYLRCLPTSAMRTTVESVTLDTLLY